MLCRERANCAPLSQANIFDRTSHSLIPGWEKVLTAFATDTVAPRMKNGTARGVFLGDELCCEIGECVTASVAPMVKLLRAVLGSRAILYTNGCAGTLAKMGEGVMLPAELDYYSVDLYTGYGPAGGGANEAAAARSLVRAPPTSPHPLFRLTVRPFPHHQFEKELYPRLSSSQGAVAVPGTFACSNTSYVPLNVSATSVVQKLDAYLEWFKADSRLMGLNPWHFNHRSSPQHPLPCDMELGAAELPGVLDKLVEVAGVVRARV